MLNNNLGRGKGSYSSCKQPMKYPYEEDEEEDEEEEEEEYANSGDEDPNDAFNKLKAKLLPEVEKVEKKRERCITVLNGRILKKWRTEIFNDALIRFMNKMHHCMQKNINVSTLQLMRLSVFHKFLWNLVDDENQSKLFVFDLKRGQRTTKTDTLKTASIYGQLVFCDDVVFDQGPFNNPVSKDKLSIQIYIEGYEWDEPQGFYELLRFFQHYSGNRGTHQDDEDDGDIGDFTPTHIIALRNRFLDILIDFMKLYCSDMNRYMEPKNDYVPSNFIIRCLEDHKQ